VGDFRKKKSGILNSREKEFFQGNIWPKQFQQWKEIYVS